MDENQEEGTLSAERDRVVDRLRDELYRRVKESRKTQRAIEEENGFTNGYLSQVLNGKIAFTVRHLVGTLMALEIGPRRFFADALDEPAEEPGEMISEIRERMARYDSAIDELEKKGLLGPHE